MSRVLVISEINLHEVIKALVEHSLTTEVGGMTGAWITADDIIQIRNAADRLANKLGATIVNQHSGV